MNEWYGVVTVNNIEDVANIIYDVLKGKTYTFVSVYEYKRYEPETRTNQQLKNGTNGSPLSVYKEDGFAGFIFCDTYGVWGLSTSNTNPAYDSTFHRPYVVVQWDKVTISWRTGENKVAHWQITLQKQ